MRPLGGLLGIRPGEGRLVGLLAALFATVEIGRGFGEIAADTLFLSRFGAESLPYMYVALGFTSLVVALGYGAAIGRLRRGPFLVALLGAFAGILAVERFAVMSGVSLVIPGLWLSIFVVGAIVTTAVWTVAGGVVDMRQAKRLFPLCTSAAIAGGFVGTLAAGPIARLVGVENLVALFAVSLVVAAALVWAIVRGFSRPAARGRGPGGSFVAELRAGFDQVLVSPLMRLVAVAYVLFSVLQFSVAFPFQRAMAAAFPVEADLATTLGLLSAAITGVSFLVSITVANRLFGRFGISTVALALPLVYLVGFGVWLVQFGLVTAIGVRFAQQVTQRGLSNAAWSAMYNVVPAERRPQILAFIDGVPGQLGTSLSGVLLLVVGALLAPNQVFVMGLVAALACVLVVWRIRRLYGEALVRTLRAGLGEQVLEGGPGLAGLARDPGVLEDLMRALGDPQPGARRLAAELLGRLGGEEAVRAVRGVLADADAEVRVAALAACTATVLRDDPVVSEAIGRALGDPAPTVRAAAVRAAVAAGVPLGVRREELAADHSPDVRAAVAVHMAGLGEREQARAIVERLLSGATAGERLAGLAAVGSAAEVAPIELVGGLLADPVTEVRTAAVGAFGRLADGDASSVGQLVAAMDDDALPVRRAAAEALRSRDDGSGPALKLLATGSDRAQEAALHALEVTPGAVRDAVRGWALRQVDRAILFRRHAASLAAMEDHGPDEPPASPEGYLHSLLDRRRMQIEGRLLIAVRMLGAGEATETIRRSLASKDTEVRAQAIEALDSLGDHQLGRQVVRLLDAESDGRPEPAAVVLRSLAEDADAWIRTFALSSLAQRLSDERRSLVERIRSDPDPIVQRVLPPDDRPEGAAMTQTDRTLGELERMLFLRRVPIFGMLAPEDLQRIAATATERLYPPDEALVREGELGDELIVIVEGTVQVIRGAGDDAKQLRTYEAGDHIGELAVLTDRPRSATVVAGAESVRGLVIGGEGLRAILRERPDAAMAMLATLAERISAQ